MFLITITIAVATVTITVTISTVITCNPFPTRRDATPNAFKDVCETISNSLEDTTATFSERFNAIAIATACVRYLEAHTCHSHTCHYHQSEWYLCGSNRKELYHNTFHFRDK